MKNLFKTSLTLALAGVMVAGAVAPVFAEENVTYQQAEGSIVDRNVVLEGLTENDPYEDGVVTENSKMETEVVYTQDSSFTVTIPKKITLEKGTKASDYTVNVQGDISSDKQVKVAPDASFLMKDQSGASALKADVTATVTQTKTVWTSAEVCVMTDGDPAELKGTDTTGNVAAPDLTAGSWKGTFNFAIALEDVQ